jgi:osmotically-inducible protein OsmY
MDNRNLSDPKDVELEATISRAIRTRGSGIHVSVKGGAISLTGSVEDFGTKREIESLVRGVAGHYPIHNSIRVSYIYP